MSRGRKLTTRILEGLENQLLNAIESESQKDIIKEVQMELNEVQSALKWIRHELIESN